MRFNWALGGLVALVVGATANTSLTLNPRQQNVETNPPAGSEPSPSPPSTSNPGPATSNNTATADSTTTITTTVTAPGDLSTTTVTVTSTIYTTVPVTSTAIATATVTSSDQQTATRVILEVTTVQISRRGLEFLILPTITDVASAAAKAALVANDATPTAPPPPALFKRALVTVFTTVTVQPGAASTVTVTVTENVIITRTTDVTVTSTFTETSQANARTTVTSTSTRTVSALVVTQTRSTSVGTSTGAPTSSPASGGSQGGLSTGAKAGIGAGVGIAALAAIAGALFFCFKRRARSSKPDPDMTAGASEVPVGPSTGARPMSFTSSGAYGSSLRTPVKPSPEGYRGTAMGDGRAGYAKPDAYGSSYSRNPTMNAPGRNGGHGPDALPEHPVPGSENSTMLSSMPYMTSPTSASSVSPVPLKQEMSPPPHFASQELGTGNAAASKWHTDSAAEIDGHQVSAHHGGGPVYEMATENYR